MKKKEIILYLFIFLLSFFIGFIRVLYITYMGSHRERLADKFRFQLEKIVDCDVLVDTISADDSKIRKRSAFLLKDCESDEVVDALIRRVRLEKNRDVRKYIYFALSERKSKKVKNVFLRCIKEEDIRIKDICFYGISFFKLNKDEMKILERGIISALNTDNIDLENTAILLVGKFKMIPLFKELMKKYKTTKHRQTQELILFTIKELYNKKNEKMHFSYITMKQVYYLLIHLIDSEKDPLLREKLISIKNDLKRLYFHLR